MRPSRKGQITLFVLAGIIVLFMVILAFYVVNLKRTETQTVPDETSFITRHTADITYLQQQLTTCAVKNAVLGLQIIGANGGHLPGNDTTNNTPPILSPTNGTAETPSLAAIQTALAMYVAQQLPLCIPATLSTTTLSVQDAPQVSINLNGSLAGTIDYLIMLSDGTSNARLPRTTFRIPFDYTPLYTNVTSFLQAQQAHPDTILISLLADLNRGQNINATSTPLDNNQILYRFSTMYETQIIPFKFIIEYPASTTQDNIILSFIPPQTAKVGQPYTYQLTVIPTTTTLTAYTDLFTLSSTGEIAFTPSSNDVGEHVITIEATHGNQRTEATFTLTVTP